MLFANYIAYKALQKEHGKDFDANPQGQDAPDLSAMLESELKARE